MNTRSLFVLCALATVPGCANVDPYTAHALQQPPITKVDFAELPLPESRDEMTSLQVTQRARIDGHPTEVRYTPLFATGDRDTSGEIWGALKDYRDRTLKLGSAPYVCNGTNDGVGSGLDHISILQRNGRLYMVSQYECSIGAMYLHELTQAPDGTLAVRPGSLRYISQKNDFGGFLHCAGQTTPWQSHLGSEEYEPDARTITQEATSKEAKKAKRSYDELAKYWGGAIGKASPYYYGYVPEVQIDDHGQPVYIKHFAMGRFSHELAYVMPDERTVYLSDDTSKGGGLFMFIADTPRDLSAGTLYAAKWLQTRDTGLGEASLEWISLGHAHNRSVRAFVDPDGDIETNDAPDFSALFDVLPVSGDQAAHCTVPGYHYVHTTTGEECLRLKDVNHDGSVDGRDEALVSRLETRRMAAYKGATTEFTKAEGITFNARGGKLYLAMSSIKHLMVGNAEDRSAIRLTENICGGVYELAIARHPTLGSEYVATTVKGLLAGEPDAHGGCTASAIANPDNLAFLPDSDTLIIGEDSDHHVNNMLWAYSTETGTATRILTVPLDAETTSPYWHRFANGFGYLTVVTQHPMKEQADADPSDKQSKAGVLTLRLQRDASGPD